MVTRRFLLMLFSVLAVFLTGCASFDGIKMPSYYVHKAEHQFFQAQVLENSTSQQRILEPFGNFDNAKRLRSYWGGYQKSYFQWLRDEPGCFVTWYVDSTASGTNFSWRHSQPTVQSTYHTSQVYKACDRFAYNEALRLWVKRGGTLPTGIGPLPT